METNTNTINPYQTGTIDTERQTGMLAATLHTAAHGLLWLGVMGMLLGVVPKYVMIFKDFGVTLPAFTVLVISISIQAVQYWYVFLMLGIVGAIADWVLLWQLARRGKKGIVWCVSIMLLMMWSLQVPMIEMMKSLS